MFVKSRTSIGSPGGLGQIPPVVPRPPVPPKLRLTPIAAKALDRMDTELLRKQYTDNLTRAGRLRETMVVQLGELLERQQIALGVPIESRIKPWDSIEEKIERKALSLGDIKELSDLIGVRLILLFRADLSSVEQLITQTFDIVSSEDTARRLGEAQFGYQSQHFVLKLPESWLTIPTMVDLGELQIEVQVRTLAQHIWAAASHKLQYKHEASVPPPIRRTIHRVSALLETVDLEFDRVLAERKNYLEVGLAETTGSEPLNVDILAALLSDVFPAENRTPHEDYEGLLSNLRALSIKNVQEFKTLLERHSHAALVEEKKQVKRRVENADYQGTTKARIDKGVFFTHTGLARGALSAEFGAKADQIFIDRKKRRGK